MITLRVDTDWVRGDVMLMAKGRTTLSDVGWEYTSEGILLFNQQGKSMLVHPRDARQGTDIKSRTRSKPRGLGDTISRGIEVVSRGLIQPCASCKRRQALLNRWFPYITDVARLPSADLDQEILLEFGHGLGDAVQLTIALQHLKTLRPKWAIDVAVLPGKETALTQWCRKTYLLDDPEFDRSPYHAILCLEWHESRVAVFDVPSTKPARCLQEVFSIKPVESLFQYRIQPTADARRRAGAYLSAITGKDPDERGRYPAVILHYQGNTGSEQKDLSHETAEAIARAVKRLGLKTVLLDWDARSPLRFQEGVANPGQGHPLWGESGTGDAGLLAALIQQAQAMVGIDSGPLHVAGATDTPTVAVWTQHHPAHFFDLADNVLHLIPQGHEQYLWSPEAKTYFTDHYQYHVYTDVAIAAVAATVSRISGRTVEETMDEHPWTAMTTTTYDRGYYEECQRVGLDYLEYGDWQAEYGRWIVESLQWSGKAVLDVGCACGAGLRGLAEAGAVMQGIDINEHMISLGRKKWPELAKSMFVCDAANLHFYQDISWDAIHASQVAENWRPALVPTILREFQRVTRSGGLLWLCLDTQELYERQQRDLQQRNPTHRCIQPRGWWEDQLVAAGWEICSQDFHDALLDHPKSFLKKYDWDWMVARRLAWDAPPVARRREPPCREDELWGRLAPLIYPSDLPAPHDWRVQAEMKWKVAQRLQPKRICEIGVRAGYSAFAFLQAVPDAYLLGIDCDLERAGGRCGLVQHARSICSPYHFDLLIADSQQLQSLGGQYDLTHVDGDHSYRGTYHDLELAWGAGGHILVDDYGSGDDPGVAQACTDFFHDRPVKMDRVNQKQMLILRT